MLLLVDGRLGLLAWQVAALIGGPEGVRLLAAADPLPGALPEDAQGRGKRWRWLSEWASGLLDALVEPVAGQDKLICTFLQTPLEHERSHYLKHKVKVNTGEWGKDEPCTGRCRTRKTHSMKQ